MKHVYLLTGRPGTGKTTLVKQALSSFPGKAGGFFTEEIRVNGVRAGFRLVTLDGRDGIMSHTGIKSSQRVSKYGVDIAVIEEIGVSALRKAAETCDLVVIDEIGKMELCSALFKQTVTEIIDAGKRMLGTVMLYSDPWTDAIKQHPRVQEITLNTANRESVLADTIRWLNALQEGQEEGF